MSFIELRSAATHRFDFLSSIVWNNWEIGEDALVDESRVSKESLVTEIISDSEN